MAPYGSGARVSLHSVVSRLTLHSVGTPMLLHFPSVLSGHVRGATDYFRGTGRRCKCGKRGFIVCPVGIGRVRPIIRRVVSRNGGFGLNLRTNSGPRLRTIVTMRTRDSSLVVYGNCGSRDCVRLTLLTRGVNGHVFVIMRGLGRLSVVTGITDGLGIGPGVNVHVGLTSSNSKG